MENRHNKVKQGLWRGLSVAGVQSLLFLIALWFTVTDSGIEASSQVDGFIVDRFFRLRNYVSAEAVVSPTITLVGIDDYTNRKLGSFGKGTWISRKPFIDQVDYMKFYKPRVLAYDIVFSDIQATSEKPTNYFEDTDASVDVLKQLEAYFVGNVTDAQAIPSFTEASTMASIVGQYFFAGKLNELAATGPTPVMAYFFSDDPNKTLSRWSQGQILGHDPDDLSEDNGMLVDVLSASIPSRFVHNLPVDFQYLDHPPEIPFTDFRESCALGLINVPRDSDGVSRRYPLVIGWRCKYQSPETEAIVEHTYFAPSIGLQAALTYWGIDLRDLNENDRFEVNGKPVIEIFMGDRLIIRRNDQPELSIPIDNQGRMYLDFVCDVTGFQNLPFATIDGNYKELLPKLRDKILFVGMTATGSTDIGPTPVNDKSPLVHVHLTATNSLLTNRFIRELRRDERWQMMIGLWLALSALAFCKPKLYSVLLFIAAAGYTTTAYWGVQTTGVIMPVIAPLAYILAAAASAILIYYMTEIREKQKIRGMFSTMVSGDVLDYMERNPGSFSLAGEAREATMFFSDVAGFTTISESLTPEKLVKLLNAYLTPMTDIIMGYSGYVDKYEGDAIMAEWGVPFENDDHAVLACYAALDQQKKLAEIRPVLKEEFGHELLVRMGLNSGRVSAGNMGSTSRFSYTVMGDAVNQAARFEPANKDYDTLIMMGESTYLLAKHKVEARLLDKIIVKGKTVPILIYELLARTGELSEETQTVIALYEEALKVHWERQFENAEALLDKALALAPDDGPSLNLKQRVAGYKQTPPPDAWQGEFVRASKD